MRIIKGVEYELLVEAVKSSYKKETNGYVLTCEIGVHEGHGSQIMLEEGRKKFQNFHHLGIDPYGNVQLGVSNKVKWNLKKDLINYLEFHLMEMTDTEYMDKYRNGVIIYDEKPQLLNRYTCVHFDGPQGTTDVLREVMFFCHRAHIGTTFCFNDYKRYKMDMIVNLCSVYGFRVLKKGSRRYIMRKEYGARA